MFFRKNTKNRVTNGTQSRVQNYSNGFRCIPSIVLTDYDTGVNTEIDYDGKTKQRASSVASVSHQPNVSNQKDSESTSSTNMHETVQEDREIIESLTKAHSSNSERHVDAIVPNTATKPQVDKIQENLKRKQTEDDITDMEVSQLTNLIESKKAFLPIHGPVKFVPSTSSLDSTSPQTPPGKLPDISDVNIMECSSSQGASNADQAFDPHSDESSTDIEIIHRDTPEMERNIIVANFSKNHGGHCDSSHCISREAMSSYCRQRPIRIRRIVRQNSQHSSSSSSVDVIEECVTSESSDDHPPQYWRLYDSNSNSTDKSDVNEDEKIDEIMQTRHLKPLTDDNSSSTSKDSME